MRTFILSLLASAFVAMLGGAMIGAALEVPEASKWIALGLMGLSLIPAGAQVGVLDTVYREVWTKQVVEAFHQGIKDTFLDGVPSFDQYVTGDDEAQVIHASYFGVEPDVLINNTTYPIAVQELDGSDIPIALDKYQTKATPITDDELYALAYPKMKLVKDAHSRAMLKQRLKKSAHAFGPADHDAEHPVLLTTGELVNGRRRMKWDDIIALRQAYSDAGIDIDGLRLSLCPEHVNDLLIADPDFKKSYVNFSGGTIINQLGFDIRQFSQNPFYNATTKAKLSYGATPTATDGQASICFPVLKTGKAMGKTKMYYSEASKDPLTQRNLINFRNYFIALPMVTKGFSALVSAKS